MTAGKRNVLGHGQLAGESQPVAADIAVGTVGILIGIVVVVERRQSTVEHQLRQPLRLVGTELPVRTLELVQRHRRIHRLTAGQVHRALEGQLHHAALLPAGLLHTRHLSAGLLRRQPLMSGHCSHQQHRHRHHRLSKNTSHCYCYCLNYCHYTFSLYFKYQFIKHLAFPQNVRCPIFCPVMLIFTRPNIFSISYIIHSQHIVTHLKCIVTIWKLPGFHGHSSRRASDGRIPETFHTETSAARIFIKNTAAATTAVTISTDSGPEVSTGQGVRVSAAG